MRNSSSNFLSGSAVSWLSFHIWWLQVSPTSCPVEGETLWHYLEVWYLVFLKLQPPQGSVTKQHNEELAPASVTFFRYSPGVSCLTPMASSIPPFGTLLSFGVSCTAMASYWWRFTCCTIFLHLCADFVVIFQAGLYWGCNLQADGSLSLSLKQFDVSHCYAQISNI